MWRYINCSNPSKRKHEHENESTSKWKKYEEKRPPRKFVESWKTGRPWLKYDESVGMTCSMCIEYFGKDGNPSNLKNVNAFFNGSTNLRLSTVTDHEKSSAHTKSSAFSKARQSTPAEVVISQSGRALLSLKEAERSRLRYLFKNAHAIAKHGRPVSDYRWMCKLDKAKGLDIGNTYQSQKAAADFIFFIAGASREKTVEMVKGANFFSFIMDGSTDISGTEQETVYIRYANKGKVHEQFLSIGSPTSTGSNDLFVFINELFDKLGIPKDKLVGMGSDGASNMTGCKTGLATQLKREHHDFVNIHCLCHRLELAFRDVVKSQKLYDKLMTLLIGLHYFYKKSHKNKTGLLRAFKALDIKGVLPPKVTGTRWLPHLSNGLECLERSFAGFEAHLATASHSNAKAEGLFKLLLDYNVVAYALFLKELLTPLMQLSKKLQKRDITLADSLTWIETTAEMIEDLKTREMPKLQDVLESGKLNTISLKGQTPKMAYKDGVIDQVFSAIHKRFQLDDSSESVAKATRILSFKNWPSDKNLADYGNKEMEFLAKTYHDRLVATDTEYSPENVTPEWDRLKRLGKRLITLSETTPTWEEVYDEDCKSAMLIIDLLLSLPPTSVSCETAFSQMKLLKTGRRVKLSQCTLDNLMQVKLATPEVGSYDPEESIDHCLTASCKPRGRRRLYYKRNVASSAGEAAVSVCLPEETPTSENANDEDEPVTNNTADASESEEEDEMEDEVVLNKLNPDDGDSDYCSDFQDEDFNYKKLLNYAREC